MRSSALGISKQLQARRMNICAPQLDYCGVRKIKCLCGAREILCTLAGHWGATWTCLQCGDVMDVRNMVATFTPAPCAFLIDRPYTDGDAQKYGTLDSPVDLSRLIDLCLDIADVTVGVLDYRWPAPKTGREVFAIAVGTGRNQRARWFTGWRRK